MIAEIKGKKTIERIVEFLVQQQIIEESASAILLIYDIYYYSPSLNHIITYNPIEDNRYLRPFGYTVNLYLTGKYIDKNIQSNSIYYSTRYTTLYDSTFQVISVDTINIELLNDEEENIYDKSLVMNLHLVHSKPFGWHWHLSNAIQLSYHGLGQELAKRFNVEFDENTRVNDISLSTASNLKYFLNSRTNFYITQNIEYENITSDNSHFLSVYTYPGYIYLDIPYKYQYDKIISETSFGSIYYINPRLKFDLSISYIVHNISNGKIDWDEEYEPPQVKKYSDNKKWKIRTGISYYLW